MLLSLQSAFGIVIFLTLAWLISEERRHFPRRLVITGLGVQLILAITLLKLPLFKDLFLALNQVLDTLQQATQTGTSFVFGYLSGGTPPFDIINTNASFILAFRVLPLVLVISALSSLLFYWRILPWLVRGISFVLQRTMSIGGAVGLAAAANVFVGMVEAPLFIRPYLAAMNRGELFAVMTCGMATIAGTVMALYASFLMTAVPDALGHILTASLVNAPGALIIAAIMVPLGNTNTAGSLTPPQQARSSIDAVTQGTLAGINLLINIAAMLVVFVALVHLANSLLNLLPDYAGQPFTLQRLLGWFMAPAAWLIGIPWHESMTAGGLLGTKVVLNELLAYLDLAQLPVDALSPRSRLIMTYALCGFANLGSMGILIGGLSSIAPQRRDEIVNLAPKAVLAGTLTTLMTAALVGGLTV
ncbi:NupC/NupG family nucleoside CNT transporter [Thiospirillum jenense]|uniref:Nucleoside:proton symporter n=1 Tax=Thiospirillum jenense TaxID=1653858 RepID=A0A839HF73_9GAMM|nr:nucleoside transporter C-terminal domain-containing protein [Thiospirillum jenense]MBB1125878.1 nucleoside:proton symporter [Thiospirillum jenense]